jgi:hypothetical protein
MAVFLRANEREERNKHHAAAPSIYSALALSRQAVHALAVRQVGAQDALAFGTVNETCNGGCARSNVLCLLTKARRVLQMRAERRLSRAYRCWAIAGICDARFALPGLFTGCRS